MTQEEEKLLLKDLAARVPYGVMVEQTLFPSTIADKEQRLKNVQANNCVQLYWYKYINEFVPIHCIKPYLRPMSSMTEEERKGLTEKGIYIDDDFDICQDAYEGRNISLKYVVSEYIDWLNKKQFDYRGLIPMGLALEAPEEMYKNK